MDTGRDSKISPIHVLIVDDHPNTAEMLARVIRKMDAPVEVSTALSAEEALAEYGDGVVDILVTDIMMPGMSGLKLLEYLHAGHKPAYTIVITAYDSPILTTSISRFDVQDYLVKPIDPQELSEIIAKAIDRIIPQRIMAQGDGDDRSFKILIADDYPDNLRLLSVRLASEGYEHVSAENGAETLEKLRTEKPDLALIDVNMPDKDGFEVLREKRADPEIANIPAIMITAARSSVEDIQEGLALGADDYVTKPVDWRELSARIRAKLRVKLAEDALRDRTKELSMLPEISQDLNKRLDIEALTQRLLSRTVEALEATNGYLIVFHIDGTPSLQLFNMFNFAPWSWGELQDRFAASGMVTKVTDTRRGRIVDDTREDTWWLQVPNEQARSAIAVPLLGRHEVLGALMLVHDRPNHFKKDHLDILHAIAGQAAIAIENARLYAIEKKRVNELVALNQLTRTIGEFTNSSALLDRLPKMIRSALHYPAVALWLKNGDGLQLKSLAGAEHAPSTSVLRLAPEQVIATGNSTQISGSIDESSMDGDGDDLAKPQSVIAVPLKDDGQVAGSLAIYQKRGGAFHESDRVLLETLAMQSEAALQRIRLFESIEQEKKRMDAVLQAAADAILLVDSEGKLRLVNLAGEQLFTDIRASVGSILELGQGYDDFIDFLHSARAAAEPTQAEICWPDQRTFSIQATPVKDGGLVLVLHDVSHFKDLERIKTELIATTSHDLKNPIHAVMGYSDLMDRAGPLNEQQKKFVEGMNRASRQMYELVLNLLEMTRLDMEASLQRQPHDLGALLAEAVDKFRSQADAKDHTLVLHEPDGGPSVNIDAARIGQVLQNLVGNAIKYTPDGGEITVSTRQDRDEIWIQIEDTGLGIPEEELPRIFDKFYRVQTKDRQDIQGNGLGLAIVKAVVEEHGGSIEVESEVGQGSCFSFCLPLASTPEPEQEKIPA